VTVEHLVRKTKSRFIKKKLKRYIFRQLLCFAVGDDGLNLTSTNAGETWTQDAVQITTNDLLAVHIAGGGVEWGPGLAVGNNKTALLYPIVVSVDDKPDVINNFYLYQNFPNPFNPNTVIGYQLPVSGNITLKIYDLLGREVAILVNEYKPSGNYEVEFNAARLSSGIYFYQLQAGSSIQTKKMVYLR